MNTSAYLVLSVLVALGGSEAAHPRLRGGINDIVDEMIWELTNKMSADGQVPLPPINETFDTTIEGIPVSGQVLLIGGKFSNISTLQRSGDAHMIDIDNATSVFTVNLTMSTAELVNENYLLKLWGLQKSGTVSAGIGTNEVAIHFTMTMDEESNCSSKLDYVVLSKLGNFSVDLGSGFFDKMASKIFTLALDESSGLLKNTVNTALVALASEFSKAIDICQYL